MDFQTILNSVVALAVSAPPSAYVTVFFRQLAKSRKIENLEKIALKAVTTTKNIADDLGLDDKGKFETAVITAQKVGAELGLKTDQWQGYIEPAYDSMVALWNAAEVIATKVDAITPIPDQPVPTQVVTEPVVTPPITTEPVVQPQTAQQVAQQSIQQSLQQVAQKASDQAIQQVAQQFQDIIKQAVQPVVVTPTTTSVGVAETQPAVATINVPAN